MQFLAFTQSAITTDPSKIAHYKRSSFTVNPDERELHLGPTGGVEQIVVRGCDKIIGITRLKVAYF
jgi:hypothetical protein